MKNQPPTSEIVAREVCKSFGTDVPKVGYQMQFLGAGDEMECAVQLCSAAGTPPQNIEVTA